MEERLWRGAVALVLALLLAGCALVGGEHADIERPAGDQRDYRHLVLDNGLKVLLVSDPDADKAAAAMEVSVGSGHDPAAWPGLAHFLEHMLFLGTEDYPRAGEYQEFISAHGGSHNAYTAFESTNYFFEVVPDALEQALDRFSGFFVAPLLSPEYIQRERNAVHSEYMMGIRDDARRAQDVLKAVVNPGHPYAGFSVGNLDTLATTGGEEALRNAMEDFYRRHYHAERMALVVVGPQSLAELEHMVRPRFRSVRSGGEPAAVIDAPLLEPDAPPRWVTLQPVRELRSLDLLWPVADPMPHWRSQPWNYVANVLGHEGEGSLLSWLKARGWAQGLASGLSLRYRGGAVFRVTIDLTSEGLEHAEEVVGAVYGMLAEMRREGPRRELYDEQALTLRQLFDYREAGSPIHEASQLAATLQRYPAQAVLRGPYAMDHYDGEQIAEALASLSPDRGLVLLTAPEVAGDARSPWYDVPYHSAAIDEELLERWRRAEPAPGMQWPEANPFVVDDQTLAASLVAAGKAEPVSLTRPGIEAWHLRDGRFGVPRANVYLGLQSPAALDRAEAAVLTELYVRMVNEELNEFVYPAHLAGMGVEVRRTLRGITVQLEGFSPRQPLLMERALEVLKAPRLEPRVLERVLQDYREELRNRAELPPFRLLLDELATALYADRWSPAQLLAALDGVTIDRLAEQGRTLLDQAHAQLLAHGSISEERADALVDAVVEALPNLRSRAVPIRVTAWPEGQWRHGLDSPHPDAALVLYLQAEGLELRRRAAFGVGLRLLEADFYRQLRTEQQLGYVVMAAPYPQLQVPGAVFIVQSPTATPEVLQQTVGRFLQDWARQDGEALAARFERHRSSLAEELRQRPNSLKEAGARRWQELMQGETSFDSRQRLAAAVEQLDFEDWLQVFREEVLMAPRALWLYDGEQAPEGRSITAWPDFHRAVKHYSFSTTGAP